MSEAVAPGDSVAECHPEHDRERDPSRSVLDALSAEQIKVIRALLARREEEKALAVLTPDERDMYDRFASRTRRGGDGRWTLGELPEADCEAFDALIRKVWPDRPESVRVLPPPHDRRAGPLHRPGVSVKTLPIWQQSVTARYKPLGRDGFRFRLLCGRAHACPMSLGEASAPNGVDRHRIGETALHMELETYGRRTGDAMYERWIVEPPADFPGFERVPDGSFRAIRPRRDWDRNGQFVRRRTGRRDAPNVLHAGLVDQENHDGAHGIRGIVGRFPRLPAVIVCRCGTPNRVDEPELPMP